MAVKGLYALQNGFMGFEKSGLFFGERSAEKVAHPHLLLPRAHGRRAPSSSIPASRRAPCPACSAPIPWRASPRPISSCTGWTRSASSPATWTWWCSRTCTTTTRAGPSCSRSSELAVQQDEYAYANYPAGFFASFYYKKNFDLPDYRWRLLDGDAEIVPGVTVLRSDGHTPGHQSLLVELPETGPVILAGDSLLLAGAPSTRRSRPAWCGIPRAPCTPSSGSRRSRGSWAAASSRATTRCSGRRRSRRPTTYPLTTPHL